MFFFAEIAYCNTEKREVKYKESVPGKRAVEQVVTGEEGFKYKYNFKEWQDELGLGVYDYGARLYDPALSRFWTIDSLADERTWVSPYNYVQNNPLNRIDPDGKLDWEPVKGLKNVWKAQLGDNAKTLAKDANIPLAKAQEVVSKRLYVTEGTYVNTGEIGMSYDENNLDKNAVLSSRHVEQTSNDKTITNTTILKAEGKWEEGKKEGNVSFFEGSHQKEGVGGINVDLLKANACFVHNENETRYGFGASVFNFIGNVNLTQNFNLQLGLTVGLDIGLDVHDTPEKKGKSVDIFFIHVGYDVFK